MDDAVQAATLEVPGATLHYGVQGAGPRLLIIPGMPADAGLYTALARELADGYRGRARSQAAR